MSQRQVGEKLFGKATCLLGTYSGLLIQGRADGLHEGHRVDRGRGRVVAEVHLEVQVWSAGVAAAAGDADDVAGGDLLTDLHTWPDELVAVAGHDRARGGAGVFDVDVPAAASGEVGVAVAVAAPVAAGAHVDGVAAHDGDDAGGGGVDRGALGHD